MPIFECSECGCIENTAVCGYWWKKAKGRKLALCSECDPEIKEWHGMFEKKKAANSGYWVGQDGFLYNPDHPPHHTKLLRAI